MKTFTYIFICLAFIVTFPVFSQQGKQIRADNLFHKFSFVKASKIYQELIDKRYNVDYATRKLGDCYALLRDPENASKYYSQVVNNENAPIEYYYKYAQALKGIKDYKNAKIWLKRYTDAGGKIPENYIEKESHFLSNIFNATPEYFIKTINFNSKFSDFGALEHDSKIYFTSARDEGVSIKRLYGWNAQPFLDIYVTDTENNNTVDHTNKLKGKVNSINHDGPVTITKDGQYMYFSSNNFRKASKGKDSLGLKNMKIYRATFKDGIWTDVEDLTINSDTFSTQHPALNSSNTKLYFASNQPGGYGGSDIYVVDILTDGSLGTPKNLGPVVNTKNAEGFPFINNEETLFFSSDGHIGLGLLDIYATVTDKNNTIIDVINLGVPVNTNMDDFSFTMNPDGLTGYLASNRPGGVGDDDIYVYNRIPPLQVEGHVYDAINGKPIANATITLYDDKGNEIAYVQTDENGYYKTNIDRNRDYKIEGSHDKYQTNSKTFSSKNIPTNTTSITADLMLTPIRDVIKLAELNTIYFDFDKHNIRKDAATELDKVVHLMLNEYPNMVIRLESHTDARGSLSYNDTLSSNRAKSTYEYLIAKGVNKTRVTKYEGFGERQLINNCKDGVKCSEKEHQLNRRTEFIIIKME